jgi:hypothetical protein
MAARDKIHDVNESLWRKRLRLFIDRRRREAGNAISVQTVPMLAALRKTAGTVKPPAI